MGQVALVTGAGRGIGLELVRQLADRDYEVFATVRVAGSEELETLAHERGEGVHVLAMDVGDDAAVAAAVKTVAARSEHLDLLVNNAGIYPRDHGGLERLDLDELVAAYQVNTLGPLRVARAFLPLLRKGQGKRIVQITSLMGSIGDNSSGGSYAYRMSKAALNMANRNLAHELASEGFVCIAIHPGWVRTRMGGSGGTLDLREATEQVLQNALETTEEHSGSLRGPGATDLPF